MTYTSLENYVQGWKISRFKHVSPSVVLAILAILAILALDDQLQEKEACCECIDEDLVQSDIDININFNESDELLIIYVWVQNIVKSLVRVSVFLHEVNMDVRGVKYSVAERDVRRQG